MLLTSKDFIIIYLFPEIASSFGEGNFQIPIPLVLRHEPQPKTAQLSPGTTKGKLFVQYSNNSNNIQGNTLCIKSYYMHRRYS